MSPESNTGTLQGRTADLALEAIRLSRRLPRVPEAQVLRWQLLRSATSVGANYRAACRAHSRAAFAAKLSVAIEEADETLYWLELLSRADLVPPSIVAPLAREADEILAMLMASRRTARQRVGE